MRVATVNVYQFEELSDKAKEVAIHDHRDFLRAIGDISDEVTELFKYELGDLNYPVDDIQWSLSYCQGDGMAFYGRIDTDNLVKLRDRLYPGSGRTLPIKFLEECVVEIKANEYGSHYSHHGTMFISFDCDCDFLSEAKRLAVKAFVSRLKIDIVDVSKDLARKGYDLIEARESDESVTDSITSNEYEFTVDGEIYRDLDSE